MVRALGMGLSRPELIEAPSAYGKNLFLLLLISKELLWWVEITVFGGFVISLLLTSVQKMSFGV